MEDQESKTCEAKEGNGEAAHLKEGDGAKSCQSGSACGGGGGCESKGEGCSRSQFLRAAVPCVGGAWALMAAYPIYSYLTPNGG